MDVDTASDNTSIDDKIDDFCENPTRDALTEGLMSLLKPTVDQLDDRIRATRQVMSGKFFVAIPSSVHVRVINFTLFSRFFLQNFSSICLLFSHFFRKT